MLKVLYIGRNYKSSRTSRGLRDLIIKPRIEREFLGRQAFFELSLFSACNVVSKQIGWAERNASRISRKFDAIVLNHESIIEGDLTQLHWLSTLQIPKVLFYVAANARSLPADDALNMFDIVYKRERLRSEIGYDRTPENLAKLRVTMLGCPLIPIMRGEKFTPDRIPRPRQAGEPYQHDVFFSGKLKTNPIRGKILEKLHEANFNVFGGVQTRSGVGHSHASKNLSRHGDYARALKESKINIAPEGYGQFTHRHLEIWCMGGFCLSTPSVRDVTLPFAQPVDGTHYVAFDDLDDMVEKMRYYLSHDEEREAIARAGREFFEQIYDPLRHGQEIRQELERLVAFRVGGS